LRYSLVIEITVKISDELAARAKARGLQVQAYVEEILAQEAATNLAGNGRPRTQEEIRAWLDPLAQFSDKIPPLPETVSREWIYQDRDQMAIDSCLVDTNILLRMTRRSHPQHKIVPLLFSSEPV
jgi:post-segregation antitoxin (ccd killing protein)